MQLKYWFQRIIKGQPHAVIQTQLENGEEIPQLIRWWVIPRNRFFNIYLHKVIWDDVDRALHDHPWWSFSILLKGRLGEVDIDPEMLQLHANLELQTPMQTIPHRHRVFRPGQVRIRPADYLHRLTLPNKEIPAWTIFITGPKIRKWGFLCPKGWMRWERFVARGEDGKMRGCGED